MCPQCARSTQSPIYRFYSSGAAGAAIQPLTTGTTAPPTDLSAPKNTSTTQNAKSLYRIKSGIILTRAPLLTRDPTPFEASYFLYQKRLDERLVAPFRKAFYFRLDTPAELDWRLKSRERHGIAARDVGRYNPRGRVAWNDEVLVGSPVSDPAVVVERLAKDAEMRISEDGEEVPEEDRVKVERPRPRRTEADEAGDEKRLDRELDRTLYLVVKRGEKDPWEFPSADVLTHENLHEVSIPC